MSRALQGITVLDLGQVYNGPYCSHLLGQLGARIVKVEPLTGDPTRRTTLAGRQTSAFQLLNGGKRSLGLNLKRAHGRELLERLVKEADVLVENFAPGVMDRLALSYAELQEINPRLIYASGRGYAPTSPLATHRAMDLTVQATTAVISVTGEPDRPPVKSGPAIADFLGGVHLAAAVLAALYQRETTGRGQHVEVAMQDAVVPSLASSIAGFIDNDGAIPERTGNRHAGLAICPYNVYPASDGWLAILCLNDRHWSALCELMRRPDLAEDPALSRAAGRVAAMRKVDDIVAEWSCLFTRDWLSRSLGAVGVPVAAVSTVPELLDSELVGPERMLRPTETTDGQSAYTLGTPLRLGDSPSIRARPAPALGEQNEQILTEMLSLGAADIQRLRAEQVIS